MELRKQEVSPHAAVGPSVRFWTCPPFSSKTELKSDLELDDSDPLRKKMGIIWEI